jgi:phosphoribosylaminoimidazole (AIR) synthetase
MTDDTPTTTTAATYEDAGVNINAGNEAVLRMKEHLRSTFTPGVLADVGSFGAMFALDTAEASEPVLVSSMDGVGTKLKIAVLMNKHDTVGRDLVWHCVNDILVQGARPLFFLDYFGTGKLSPTVAATWSRGLPKGAGASAAHSWAAKRPNCPACTGTTNTTLPAASSAWSSGAASWTAAGSNRRTP